jgi:hypothetical protein
MFVSARKISIIATRPGHISRASIVLRWKIDAVNGTEIDGREAYWKRLTSLLCVQYIANGDSGEFFTMHVKLMVEPVLM